MGNFWYLITKGIRVRRVLKAAKLFIQMELVDNAKLINGLIKMQVMYVDTYHIVSKSTKKAVVHHVIKVKLWTIIIIVQKYLIFVNIILGKHFKTIILKNLSAYPHLFLTIHVKINGI